MSILQLTKVSYTYPNGFTAIEDVSMNIARGEFVAIVGQNGAGKTTTVKLMNGLLKPSTGEVLVDGCNTKEYTVAQLSRKAGYIFQNPDDQIFNNDVYSEVEFGPKNLGLPPEKIEEYVKKAIDLTRIRDYINENPYNIPYSTRKFVTIASILAMEPDAIILDEPTAGQDIYGMETLSDMLKELKHEGKTVITITHDMEFVVKNFERVIVMANKRIIADGNKKEIFWDHEILAKSMLKQPHISRVAHRLAFENNILDIDEMLATLKDKLT